MNDKKTMMMKKAFLYIILLSFLLPGMLRAQGGYSSIQYVMGFGTGDVSSFISQPSFRGVAFDYQRYISENLSAGVELGWNVFYEKMDYDTYTVESISLSGKQYRYFNNFPMLATIQYNLNPDQPLNFYANLGIGTMYSIKTIDMGMWRLEDKSWHFALKPEIGVMYEMNHNAALKLAGKYYTGFATGSADARSYFAISAGFAFLL
jgi:hypothetical protein